MQADLQTKLGQLFFVGFEGYTLTKEIKSFLRTVQPGGIILFECNIKTKKQVQKLIQDINDFLDIKPFIAVDQEGGSVERLRNICTGVPSLWGLSKVGLSETLQAQEIIIKELIELGINMNLSPVLDINSNKENPVIGTRSISERPEIVSKYGFEIVNLNLKYNLIPVIKHFPGHGDVNVDSHLDLPILNKSKSELERFELIPFKTCISAPVLMTAHLALPKIEKEITRPASLSKEVIKILRKDLGFEGLIITDELNMKGVAKNYKLNDATFQAIINGTNLVLFNHESDSSLLAFDFLKQEVTKDKELLLRVEDSFKKIQSLKSKFFKKRVKKVKIAKPLKTAEELASKVVHWIKKDIFFKPINKLSKLEIIYPITPKLKEYYFMEIFNNLSLESYSLVPYEINPNNESINEVIKNLKKKTVKVLITYDSACRKGQRALVNKLLEIEPNIVLISVGLEYDIEITPKIKNFIAAYAPNFISLRAAFEKLLKSKQKS